MWIRVHKYWHDLINGCDLVFSDPKVKVIKAIHKPP